ncbi:hypothetical protein [Staphylococcus cohnii]|uniref:hypothetical protein n=1 Tax=Staphylococcus cohnii TaxID=29382 RepID=UPI0018690B99|nr:hypothetical protein [Staphylococcus cohnii]
MGKSFLAPGKSEEIRRGGIIKAIKDNNVNLTPVDITYESNLSNSEIDSIIVKLNNMNKANSQLINNLLKYKSERKY